MSISVDEELREYNKLTHNLRHHIPSAQGRVKRRRSVLYQPRQYWWNFFSQKPINAKRYTAQQQEKDAKSYSYFTTSYNLHLAQKDTSQSGLLLGLRVLPQPQQKFFIHRVIVTGDDAEFIEMLANEELPLDSSEKYCRYFEDFLEVLKFYSHLSHVVNLDSKPGMSYFESKFELYIDLNKHLKSQWSDTKILLVGRQALSLLETAPSFYPRDGYRTAPRYSLYIERRVFCPSWVTTFSVNCIYCITTATV